MYSGKLKGRLWQTGLMAALILLMLPMGIWAEVDGKMATTISIASAPSSVTFNASATELDKAVYKAMNIVVIDSDYNKIDFTPDEITLDYNRQVGTQKISVTFKGDDQYEASTATGTIIINDVPKKDNRLVLKANPPAVGYSADTATLDRAVYDDLVIQVVDGDSNKVNFAPTLGEFLSILRKFTTIPRISKETTAPCADFIAE